MKKRIMAAMLCGILAVASLTGCGDTGADGPTATIQQSAKEQESSGAPEGAATPDGTVAEPTAGVTSEAAAEATAGDERQPGRGGSSQGEEMQEVENIMPDIEITMQDVSPMDLVKEMKIGWNLGNTLMPSAEA